jgi:formate dehydrogenase assembly factor FdhD
MAGLGRKTFAQEEILRAADVNGYLMDQSVMRFADSGARGSAIGTAVSEGMVSYLDDVNAIEVYDGSAWVSVSGNFVSQTNGTVTTAAAGSAVVRNITLATAVPGTAVGMDGDVWLVYEP